MVRPALLKARSAPVRRGGPPLALRRGMTITPKRLSALLRNILTLSIATAGCGGIDVDELDPVPCADGRPDYLTGLVLAEPADYIELREGHPDFVMSGAHTTLQTSGTKCAKASDAAACEAAIAAATSKEGLLLGECFDICSPNYFVVNRGQDVVVVDSKEGLLALLGPVNSPADAVLVAAAAGYNIGCGDSERGGVLEGSGKYEVIGTRTTQYCDPVEVTRYRLEVGSDGQVKEVESDILSSESGVCIGRRPAGLLSGRIRRVNAVGAYWANVAHLEAASVHAFATLRRELEHHGAPSRLLRAAARSMRDEVRHAAVTRSLAARYGATAPRPRVERGPVRPLEDIAVENAVEGCVRETFGALIGGYQARFARDPAVRRAMRSIAQDEARHATLAWAVDAWARSKLSAAAWERVEAARAAALAELDGDDLGDPSGELARWTGLPGERARKELAGRLREAIQA